MPLIMVMEGEPAAHQRLGMENGFEKSPMAKLIREYTSVLIELQLGLTEMSITFVISLEELTLDLIIDRGENISKTLPHYHLVTATMSNICTAVNAQQIFLQLAAAMIVERKSHFRMRGHWVDYLKGIKEKYLGHNWEFDTGEAYKQQYFRQPGHKKEFPKTFIACCIMY